MCPNLSILITHSRVITLKVENNSLFNSDYLLTRKKFTVSETLHKTYISPVSGWLVEQARISNLIFSGLPTVVITELYIASLGSISTVNMVRSGEGSPGRRIIVLSRLSIDFVNLPFREEGGSFLYS